VYALSISLLVFVLMFAGAFAGVAVRPLLLEKHVHPDSREVVKMATGDTSASHVGFGCITRKRMTS
jgi:hypothetical protein